MGHLVAGARGAARVRGLQVLARKPAGAILGFTLAGLNAFTQFAFIGAYPAWAIWRSPSTG